MGTPALHLLVRRAKEVEVALFEGLVDFLRVARAHRPAKSLTGIGGSLDWCAPSDTQMAKVERIETVLKRDDWC